MLDATAAGAGRVPQELTAAARRVGRAQLRALLRDGRHAALPSARTRKYSEAAVGSCGRVQPELDPAQAAGCGYAAGVEEPLRQACFACLFTLHASDKSESALQKSNLRIRATCFVRSRSRLRRPTCRKSATCTPGC